MARERDAKGHYVKDAPAAQPELPMASPVVPAVTHWKPIYMGGRLLGFREPDGTVHKAGLFASCPLVEMRDGKLHLKGGDPETIAKFNKLVGAN